MHSREFGPEAELNRVKIRRYKKELRKKVEAGLLNLDKVPEDDSS